MNEWMKTLFQATRAHKNTTHTHRTAEKEKKRKIKRIQRIKHNYKETRNNLKCMKQSLVLLTIWVLYITRELRTRVLKLGVLCCWLVILVYGVLFSLLKTLLDLGSSANYKDKSGLTPLYVCVVNDEVLAASQRCVDMLLYDHTTLGIRNSFGWTELHQVPSFTVSDHRRRRHHRHHWTWRSCEAVDTLLRSICSKPVSLYQ